MGMFSKIEGAVAITSLGGVYHLVGVYTCNGLLYAGHGSGFVRVYRDGSTTKPKLRWLMLNAGCTLYANAHGTIGCHPLEGFRIIDACGDLLPGPGQ